MKACEKCRKFADSVRAAGEIEIGKACGFCDRISYPVQIVGDAEEYKPFLEEVVVESVDKSKGQEIRSFMKDVLNGKVSFADLGRGSENDKRSIFGKY